MHMPEALGVQNQLIAGGENRLIEELPEGEAHFHVAVLLCWRGSDSGMYQVILAFGLAALFVVGITMPELATKFPSEDCGILEAIFSGSVISRS